MRPSPASLLLIAVAACVVRDPNDDTSIGSSGSNTTTDPSAASNTDPTTGDAVTTGALENPSGFCSPAEAPGDCPESYICCSDDPATTRGRLPNYFTNTNDDTYGVPIFSGANNSLSYSGQCADVGGFASPFASGCPVPCNPTWNATQRDTICGPSTQCCPFQQLDPDKDCIIDPDTQLWRSVRGTDIGTGTQWGPQHTTNQDPIGESCTTFASGGGGVEPDKDVVADCYKQLTVADQRGFCYQSCPCYEDLCDMKNPGWVPRC